MEDVVDKQLDAVIKLREKVNLRNQMGGSLYWNALNDECCKLADECISLGCTYSQISEILEYGTFR